MPRLDESVPALAAALQARYGRPAPSISVGDALDPFSNLLAAALERHMDRPKANRILQALAESGLETPDALAQADVREIGDVLRAVGLRVRPQVAALLQRLARWLTERHGGDVAALEGISTEQIRDELASINGIGAATADDLALNGLGRGAIPVERSTYRILVRHGWVDLDADYDTARSVLEAALPEGHAERRTWQGWLERVGRDYCKIAAPRCEQCPMRLALPPSGPIEPD